MLRIIWKSFAGNIKNFLVFFCSVIMSVNVLFLLMYIREASRHIQGVETKALAFAYASELSKELRTVIIFIIFVTIIVVAYSVKFYIQSRMKDYGMLTILGIRKKDMKNIIIAEYTISCVFSCVIGLVLGRVCTGVLGKILKRNIGENFVESISMNRVYLLTFAMCIVMILGAVFAIFVMLDSRGTDHLVKTSVMKEKRIISWKSLLCLLAGVALVCLSIWMIKNNPMSANIAVFVLCLGIFISVCFGFGYILEKYRRSDRYCLKILEWNQFYHYFNKNKFKIIVSSILGILIIYFSFLMLRSTLDLRLMPNDFACIEKEEGNFEQEFLDKFGGSEIAFPFIWVDENAGDSWIGISVSDYNRIYGKQEELKQDEVVRIWRIEGTTDDMTRNSGENIMESIDLGECRNSDTEGAKYIYNFKVKKEEIKELLGFSMTGVIVMPDETFEKAAADADFHQRFMLFNVDEPQLDEATGFVEQKREEGILEEAFCRKTIESTDLKENILNRLIVGIVGVVIVFFSAFVMWLMLLAEVQQNKEKYKFLSVIGLRRGRAKRVLDKEIERPIVISIIITVMSAAVFCKTFIDTYYSGMQDVFDKAGAGKLLLMILAAYAVIEFLFVIVSRSWMRKQVIGKGGSLWNF